MLDETTDAVEVVNHLDHGLYAQDDPFPDWHDATPFEPMLRAVLLGELEDASGALRHRTLEDSPEVATALDFDPDDVPDRCTISRARRNRFEALETKIDVSTRQIKVLAARRSSPIGAPTADDASEGPTGSSKRVPSTASSAGEHAKSLLRHKSSIEIMPAVWTEPLRNDPIPGPVGFIFETNPMSGILALHDRRAAERARVIEGWGFLRCLPG